MEHLVLPSNHLENGVIQQEHNQLHVGSLPSLRTDERIGEILNESKETKEDVAMRNYRPEDFLMLLPQEASSGEYVPPPNPFQSACTMCPTCKRVLVFPANADEAIQCPACKKIVEVEALQESKLLRTCPQCDTLLGNPTNAPKVLCPLCMKLIEWSGAKEAIMEDGELLKKKRTRKSKEPPSPVVVGANPDGTPIYEGSPQKRKKGYVKKGETGYVKPKYNYVRKGQPGYIRPKYGYVKKGSPGYVKPRGNKGKGEDDSSSPIELKLEDVSEEAAAAALLNQAIDATVLSEGLVRQVDE